MIGGHPDRDLPPPRFEETAKSISLHGLGFLQVKLWAKQRLHVWHPDLPRRKCFEYSAIHDHRFGFDSLILVGSQLNHIYGGCVPHDKSEATHVAYQHEGRRSEFGNRPWIAKDHLMMFIQSKEKVDAGSSYNMLPYVFHATQPGGDGRVATLMTKTYEGETGARSLCEVGVEPDVDFDRFQMSEDDMWSVVREVLSLADRS